MSELSQAIRIKPEHRGARTVHAAEVLKKTLRRPGKALVFAMIGILIAFPKAKDVMATVASGALAMVAVMTLPRRPTA